MNYIILKSGFCKGISLFKSTGLKIYHKDELPKVLSTVGQELLDEGAYNSVYDYERDCYPELIGDKILVCEISTTIDGQYIGDYIRYNIVESRIKQSNEEYELYLKLKEKFEN
jgi:hypothetical protein